MARQIYSLELGEDDRAALARVATEWAIKRSDAVRLAIRVLAEAVDAQGRAVAVPIGPRPVDAPKGEGAADER